MLFIRGRENADGGEITGSGVAVLHVAGGGD